MAAKRRLSKWHSFFWLLVLVAVAIGMGNRGEHADVLLYNNVGKILGKVPTDRTLHLLHEGQTAPREPDNVVETRHLECPTVAALELDDETTAGCFAALPLGPQDTAVLLHKLSEQGIRHLAISAPLAWQENAPPIARQMVALGLTRFEHATVGIRGRTAADADFTPAVLLSSRIPSEQVEGDTTGLPSCNKVIENDLLYISEAQQLCWAPDRLEDERLTQNAAAFTERSFPLLVRWNGEILPTLPLRMAMQIKGLSPSQLKIRMGKDIRLGDITLPLDEHGRTKLPQAAITTLKTTDVIDGRTSSTEKASIAMLSQPTDGKAEERRPQLLAATISQLCATEIVEQHTEPGAPGLSLMYHNPVKGWLPLSILAIAALFAVRVLPYFPAILRHFVLLAALGGVFWYANEMMQQGFWFHISTAIVTWLVLCLSLAVLRPVQMKGRKR